MLTTYYPYGDILNDVRCLVGVRVLLTVILCIVSVCACMCAIQITAYFQVIGKF